MAAGASYIPFGKRIKIAMVEQNTPQQELARRLGIANSTASDVTYGHNQYGRTKKRIAEVLGIKG